MRLRSAVLAASALCSVCATATPLDTKPALDFAKMESFIDGAALEAMGRDEIAGLVVAVVGSSGSQVIKGYGMAAPERPVTPDTLFNVQSISKTIVWIAISQLVESKQIGLDDPINSRLPPEMQIPEEGFRHPILIRHLMEHSAGFEDSALGHLIVDRDDRSQPFHAYLRSHRVHRVREPGIAVVYSNFGASLAALIVEHVSGLSWEEFASQRILRPLSMRSATFRQFMPPEIAKSLGLPVPMPKELADRFAVGFRPEHSQLEVAPREYTNDPPAGALSASANDMASYMYSLLDPQLIARQGVLTADDALLLRNPLRPLNRSLDAFYHGFEAFEFANGIVGFGHGGDSAYQVSTLVIIPALGIGIFAAANAPTAASLVRSLPSLILAEFNRGTLAPAVYDAASHEAALQMGGTYRNLRRPFFRTERGVYDLFIDTVSVRATERGDLLFSPAHRSGPGAGGSSVMVPLGRGIYRDFGSANRVAFRQSGDQMIMDDPSASTTWERIGFFESPTLIAIIAGCVGALALFWIAAYFAKVRAGCERVLNWDEVAIVAASTAWILGFVFCGMFLMRGLTAQTPVEILHWYPSVPLVMGCWAFAAAGALSALAPLAIAASKKKAKHLAWQSAARYVTIAVFLTGTMAFWRLNLLGFSGW